jgi:hypothetical protein
MSRDTCVAPFAQDRRLKYEHEAELFCRLLHGDAHNCFVRFVSISSKGAFDYYQPPEKADAAARATVGDRDHYIGLNTYRFPRGPMAGIKTIHADLDYYKSPKWHGADPWQVTAAVFAWLHHKAIPRPTLVVFTVRGLQLIWRFPTVINRAAPKAKAAMRALVSSLAEFGADPACTDLARPFRIPGTINSKSGAVARLLCTDNDELDFDPLCAAILGPRKAKSWAAKPHKAKSERARAENRSLAHQRLADLQRLILGRWRGKVPEGYRNIIAHLAAVHIVQLSGDPLDNLTAWCAKWTDNHGLGEMRRTLKTAIRIRYRYKGVTIGKKLDVTAEEVIRYGLKTIYAATDTAEDVKRRQRERDAEYQRDKLRAHGANPHSESAERLKPWQALGIGRSTYFERKAAERPAATGQAGASPPIPLAPLRYADTESVRATNQPGSGQPHHHLRFRLVPDDPEDAAVSARYYKVQDLWLAACKARKLRPPFDDRGWMPPGTAVDTEAIDLLGEYLEQYSGYIGQAA